MMSMPYQFLLIILLFSQVLDSIPKFLQAQPPIQSICFIWILHATPQVRAGFASTRRLVNLDV